MFELDDLGPLSSLSEVSLPKQSSPTIDYEEVNDDDDDDECDYDDDDDEGVDTSYQDPSSNRYDNNNNHHHHRRFFGHIHQHQQQQQRVVYLLGQAHDVVNQHPTTTTTAASSSTTAISNALIELIQNYQQHLYWCTYRSELIVPLRPYNSLLHAPHSFAWNASHTIFSSPFALKNTANSIINNNDNDTKNNAALEEITDDNIIVSNDGTGMNTDAGWGCMLRSAQMLLAETVRRHYSSFKLEYKNKNNKEKDEKTNRKSREEERIARWFADFPNHSYSQTSATATATTTTTTNNDKTECNDTEDGGIDYHWYSLHSMVAAGLGLGMLPGEWYGPNMVCHVLLELNAIHCASREEYILLQRKRSSNNNNDNSNENNGDEDNFTSTSTLPQSCDVFRVHVATGGTIYVDAITKLMTSSTIQQRQQQQQQQRPSRVYDGIGQVVEDEKQDKQLPNDDEFDDPLRSTTTIPEIKSNDEDDDDYDDGGVEWDTSLLLLLPLRLGINSISTSDYGSTLSKLMSFPHSVGMIGGTPRHALWFYGSDAVDDVNSHQDMDGGWYGLDPHIVQLAPRGVRVSNVRKQTSSTAPTWEDVCYDMASVEDTPPTLASIPTYRWQVQLTNSYLTSLHTSPSGVSHPNHKRAIPLSKLDPSCALGFYIHNRSDFIYLRQLIRNLRNEQQQPQHRNKLPDVITVMTRTPRYELEDCSAGVLNDSLDCGLDGFAMPCDDVEHEEENDNDDDDDFVLI